MDDRNFHKKVSSISKKEFRRLRKLQNSDVENVNELHEYTTLGYSVEKMNKTFSKVPQWLGYLKTNENVAEKHLLELRKQHLNNITSEVRDGKFGPNDDTLRMSLPKG